MSWYRRGGVHCFVMGEGKGLRGECAEGQQAVVLQGPLSRTLHPSLASLDQRPTAFEGFHRTVLRVN